MRNQTRNINSEQVERLPIYESILLTIQRWLHVGGFFASVLLGCVPLALGCGLSIILGVSEEFIFVSIRLIYWLVIIFAFAIMHIAYRVWLDYRPYICALFKEESKHAEVLDVFSHPVYQCISVSVHYVLWGLLRFTILLWNHRYRARLFTGMFSVLYC